MDVAFGFMCILSVKSGTWVSELLCMVCGVLHPVYVPPGSKTIFIKVWVEV